MGVIAWENFYQEGALYCHKIQFLQASLRVAKRNHILYKKAVHFLRLMWKEIGENQKLYQWLLPCY